MMTLKSIGVNAGQGLLDGLSSMESSLVKKARTIAESVKSAMANALDIKSPSRWMRDFIAGNMALGFIKGVDKNESKIVGAASHFGDLMKPNLSDVLIPSLNFALPNLTGGLMGGFGAGGSGGSASNSPIVVSLEYHGEGSVEDAMHMVDIVEREFENRRTSILRWNGMKG